MSFVIKFCLQLKFYNITYDKPDLVFKSVYHFNMHEPSKHLLIQSQKLEQNFNLLMPGDNKKATHI